MRSGDTNIWNDRFYRSELPEVKLDPPMLGLYAERFDDGWYWVCGCSKCLGNGEPYPYIVCDDHNRCETCGKHRRDLSGETAWGVRGGFQCDSCHKAERTERKKNAIKSARRRGHSEDDCYRTTEIICPVCASEYSDDDLHQPGEHEVTCGVCDTEFSVEIEYEARYTSHKQGRRR
jgi:hypothetical protein